MTKLHEEIMNPRLFVALSMLALFALPLRTEEVTTSIEIEEIITVWYARAGAD
jgi:hypothetical protein